MPGRQQAVNSQAISLKLKGVALPCVGVLDFLNLDLPRNKDLKIGKRVVCIYHNMVVYLESSRRRREQIYCRILDMLHKAIRYENIDMGQKGKGGVGGGESSGAQRKTDAVWHSSG